MSPHRSRVRPGRQTDAAVLERLQALLSEPSPQLLSAAIRERSTSVPFTTSTLLVTTDSDDRPVGYLLAVGTEPIHIAELVVAPEFRRERRASDLLQTVCESATEPVTVHVSTENNGARSLYRAVGFTESDRSSALFDSSEGLTLQYRP